MTETYQVKRHEYQIDIEENQMDKHYTVSKAGIVIDRLVKVDMAAHPNRTYSEAFRAVVTDPENRALVMAYAATAQSHRGA